MSKKINGMTGVPLVGLPIGLRLLTLSVVKTLRKITRLRHKIAADDHRMVQCILYQ